MVISDHSQGVWQWTELWYTSAECRGIPHDRFNCTYELSSCRGSWAITHFAQSPLFSPPSPQPPVPLKVKFAMTLQPYVLKYRSCGGAIDASSDCTISFLGNVSFVSNTANQYGGAIHTASRVITSFLNSVRFTHNSAREGGAVHLQRSSKLIFQRKATFINNRAGYAGSLSVSLQSNITFGFLSILIIRGSRADSSGDGIVLTDAQMVFKGKAVIEGNEAGSFGGAVFAVRSNISLHGVSLISKNKAQYGGALHAIDSHLDFTGKHFFWHNSGQFGGGWSLVGSTLLKCSDLGNLTFETNFASQYRGAIWIEDASSCED